MIGMPYDPNDVERWARDEPRVLAAVKLASILRKQSADPRDADIVEALIAAYVERMRVNVGLLQQNEHQKYEIRKLTVGHREEKP